MSYVPHPSTIAHRAIEHLKGLPPGGTIATGPLAEILGTDTGTVLTGLQTAIKHEVVVRERINGLFHFRMSDQSACPPASPPPLVDKPAAPKVEAPKPKLPAREFSGVNIDGPRVSPKPEPKPAPPPESKVDLPKPDVATEAVAEWDKLMSKPEKLDGVDIDVPRKVKPDPVPESPTPPAAEPVVDPLPVAMPPVVLVSEAQPFRFSWCNDGTITVSKGGSSVVLDGKEYDELARFIYVLRNHL